MHTHGVFVDDRPFCRRNIGYWNVRTLSFCFWWRTSLCNIDRDQNLSSHFYRRKMKNVHFQSNGFATSFQTWNWIDIVSYISANGFKKPNATKTFKYMFMQFIVHIHLFSHDMKVRHRPVLDSCRRQSERLVCAVLQYLSSIATVPASRKKKRRWQWQWSAAMLPTAAK